MVKEIQFRRGSTTDHISGVGFTGALAEVTVDTTNKTLRVHDGSTKGGHELVGVAATQRITNKDIEATTLIVSGVTTLPNVSRINVTGVATATEFDSLGITTTRDLQVVGITTTRNLNITGVATATEFDSLGITTTRDFLVIGVSTVVNGPLFVGAATSTGTESQPLQVNGGTYVSGNVGLGTTNPPDKLTVSGKIQIQQDSSSNNRLVFRGQPGSSYRWNIDNNGSSNDFRIFREDDDTAANGVIPFGISSAGNILINGVTPTGTASQQLQVNSGAYFASNVGIASTNPTADLHIVGPGTSTAGSAPIKVSVGSTFMLATPEADAIEYDRLNLYHTPNDTTNGSGRTIIPGVQFIRRTSDLSINDTTSPGTSFFGATTRPALLAGLIYEIEAVIYATKVTNAGTVTVQASLSTGNFTFATLQANTAATAVVIGGTTSPVTIFTSASLTAGVSYGFTIRGLIQPASNSRLDLLAYSSTATISALSNSYLKVTCLGRGNNIGNIA